MQGGGCDVSSVRKGDGHTCSLISHCDDDLADLLVRLQEAVGLDDLVQRERPGDERLETAVGEPSLMNFFARSEAPGSLVISIIT